MPFNKVDPKQRFPQMETDILGYWQKKKIFQKSIDNRQDKNSYVFYDGPPFATGTPHYGHILAGVIKDVIPRYWTMRGKKVERKFGWDCHGLPIENIVEKKLWISWKEDIEKNVGIHEFNEECRRNVFGYVNEWRFIVERMGRWVDMDNDYKTMDNNFMESIWWVFKSIYDKWLIYEWYKVVPYCPRCSTPLSNFEVNQWYADKQDKSITVKFKIKGEENRYILAWTTTPWTLAANLWLAVWENVQYIEVKDLENKEHYILAEDLIHNYYKNDSDYEIIKKYTWKELIGIKYKPIFSDFITLNEKWKLADNHNLGENAYSIVLWHHVTTESGTGIVHIAPAYGEDDYQIGKKHKLWFVAHIDDTGKTEHLINNNWTFVFDYNELVIQELKENKKLIKIASINHSYPHCWRCDTPLIYRAISAWYVAVEKIREKMVANNQKIHWIPENIKDGRFGVWIANAIDWNISRNRYWGSAIPIWQSEDKSNEVCVGSIEELYELNKEYWQIEKKDNKFYLTGTDKEIDLHKHYVDKIFVKCPKSGEKLTRVPEVLDCWFESGSMPYASKHYPFENKNNFKFPADFIAEGLDQTRGWFYTLLILGTALFDNTPFLNCIVNGTVLAEDGQKMSKSKQNYPDPSKIFDEFWADAMRCYLMSSSVVEAKDFRFAKKGVEEIVKKVLLPLWNSYSFFVTYANIDKIERDSLQTTTIDLQKLTNPLDQWILSILQTLLVDVNQFMEDYKLTKAIHQIFAFIDSLTNWYIRRSRRRFWKSESDQDKLEAYQTLYFVLIELTKIIAPFAPFISEEIFRNLTNKESVHLEDWSVIQPSLIKPVLETEIEAVRDIISIGLAIRANQNIKVRQPLPQVKFNTIVKKEYLEVIKEELNVKKIVIVNNVDDLAQIIVLPNAKILGPQYGKNVQFIIKEAKAGHFEKLANGEIKVNVNQPDLESVVLKSTEFEVRYETKENLTVEAKGNLVVAFDTNITPELKKEGEVRDLVRIVQNLRKQADYNLNDHIQLTMEVLSGDFNLDELGKEYLSNETLSTIQDNLEQFDIEDKVIIGENELIIRLKK